MNETLQSFMIFGDMHLFLAMFTKMTLFEVRIWTGLFRYTLRPVNDATEGSTQVAPMRAS